MLPKKYRLPIQNLPNKAAKSIRSSYLTIKIFTNNLNHPRFGVIISKKIAKSAVVRNNLKRIIFNTFQRDFSKIKPADYLVIINKYLEKDDLVKELNRLFA